MTEPTETPEQAPRRLFADAEAWAATLPGSGCAIVVGTDAVVWYDGPTGIFTYEGTDPMTGQVFRWLKTRDGQWTKISRPVREHWMRRLFLRGR